MMEALKTVDMTELIIHSHELSTMINQSREVSEYILAKQAMEADEEAQRLLALFERKKTSTRMCSGSGNIIPITIKYRKKSGS